MLLNFPTLTRKHSKVVHLYRKKNPFAQSFQNHLHADWFIVNKISSSPPCSTETHLAAWKMLRASTKVLVVEKRWFFIIFPIETFLIDLNFLFSAPGDLLPDFNSTAHSTFVSHTQQWNALFHPLRGWSLVNYSPTLHRFIGIEERKVHEDDCNLTPKKYLFNDFKQLLKCNQKIELSFFDFSLLAAQEIHCWSSILWGFEKINRYFSTECSLWVSKCVNPNFIQLAKHKQRNPTENLK